ncbi:MAG: ABC transporter substrate-binding protein [SAR324 cluster bacterium]|nr:ABC transporter substrate-binding protein [SAR324 cluster bacterium]
MMNRNFLFKIMLCCLSWTLFTGMILTDVLAEDCGKYDPDRDYFPHKTTLRYAKGFSVSYHQHYKLLEIPMGADNSQMVRYWLVQCGTPVPEHSGTLDQVIIIPSKRVIPLATTYLPFLVQYGMAERIVGVSRAAYVNTPLIRERLKSGQIKEIGVEGNMDFEAILKLEPSWIMPIGDASVLDGDFGKLRQMGVPVVLHRGFLEETLLASVEWGKMMALFFNAEDEAERHFEQIRQTYESLADKVRQPPRRPVVLAGSMFQGVWYVSGGKSFLSRLIHDAGARYLWEDTDFRGNRPYDFESLLSEGQHAEFWINPGIWNSRQEAMAEDPRYGLFDAMTHKGIYNNNRQLSPDGGNDYWENGLANPHLLLADLIKIFHSEVIPDHELIWYKQLE